MGRNSTIVGLRLLVSGVPVAGFGRKPGSGLQRVKIANQAPGDIAAADNVWVPAAGTGTE
jgi:hypothetical protein